MNDIDMYGYVKRFPKFGKLPIMFMNDYNNCPKQAVEQVLDQGYDVVLMDSWAEVTSMIKDQMGWARNKVESWLLELLEKNNKANNKANKNTAFICIQQMTKAGEFAGSNRIKHMTTSNVLLCDLMVEGLMLNVTLSSVRIDVVVWVIRFTFHYTEEDV
jgi:hypothetical protein